MNANDTTAPCVACKAPTAESYARTGAPLCDGCAVDVATVQNDEHISACLCGACMTFTRFIRATC